MIKKWLVSFGTFKWENVCALESVWFHKQNQKMWNWINVCWFYEFTKTMLSLIGMKHWQNEITTPDLSNLVRLNHMGQISSVSFCLETEVILTVWHILGFLLACMQGISSSCTIMIIDFLLDFHQIVAVHLSQSNGRY